MRGFLLCVAATGFMDGNAHEDSCSFEAFFKKMKRRGQSPTEVGTTAGDFMRRP